MSDSLRSLRTLGFAPPDMRGAISSPFPKTTRGYHFLQSEGWGKLHMLLLPHPTRQASLRNLVFERGDFSLLLFPKVACLRPFFSELTLTTIRFRKESLMTLLHLFSQVWQHIDSATAQISPIVDLVTRSLILWQTIREPIGNNTHRNNQGRLFIIKDTAGEPVRT